MMEPNVTFPHSVEPEIRSPAAPGREHNREGRRRAELIVPQAADEYHSRNALLKRHHDASSLSLYDARRLCGFIVALPYPRPSWAFDHRERCLGAYRTRRLAVNAVGAAYDRDIGHLREDPRQTGVRARR